MSDMASLIMLIYDMSKKYKRLAKKFIKLKDFILKPLNHWKKKSVRSYRYICIVKKAVDFTAILNNIAY